MSVKEWRKVSSAKHVKILQPSRKITKKSELKQQRAKEKKKGTAMSSETRIRSLCSDLLVLIYQHLPFYGISMNPIHAFCKLFFT
mmetsp:Transcript_76615/g.120972  ORF Transcript_76615/g.120972 Transcript_76615/m.120972 type:complete len:85 (-) Transcript_76615:25-279(-)